MGGYIDVEILKAMALLLLTAGFYSFSLNYKTLFLAVLFSFPLVISYSLYSSHNNFEHFKNGEELVCRGKRGFENVYLISKKEGWEILDSYFKKDSLLIETYLCEER